MRKGLATALSWPLKPKTMSRFVPGGRKGWSEPPFWTLDRLRSSLFSYTQPDKERIENDFEGYIAGAYKADGIIFACILARQFVFSQARFGWRQFRNGMPGPFFGSPDLALLEQPWPNGTTGELLMRMEVDASLAGNAYLTVADDAGRIGSAATGTGRRLVFMRPDRVTIVIGSNSGDPTALDAKPVGYLYEPSPTYGGAPGDKSVLLLPEQVCHYSPLPDPSARFRGMSWLTPVLQEISADRAATSHKLKFFEQGATLSKVVSLDKDVSSDEFDEFVRLFKEQHQGTENAWETLFLGGGADVTVVGTDLRSLDYGSTQGKSETRIAAAARVHPVILGISEGLGASGLNAAIAQPARRIFVDGTLEPLWRMAASSLQTLITPPNSEAVLCADTRNIPFLREDKDAEADIIVKKSTAIRTLTDGGYRPDSVVTAVDTGNLSLLTHTGLLPVQVQAPGSAPPTNNGNGAAQPAPANQG